MMAGHFGPSSSLTGYYQAVLLRNVVGQLMSRKIHGQMKAVKHHLPHRTRIKLPRGHRDAETITKIQRSIEKASGVKSVEVNARTGSVLIHHQEDPEILSNVGNAIDEVASELFEAILAAEGIEIPGLSIFAHVIRESLSKLDNRLAVATSNLIDLKMLLPLAFFGAGVIQAKRNRGWLDQVPAWVLFYYAYDAYMKFHGPSVRTSSAEERFDLEGVSNSEGKIGIAGDWKANA
jgi:hypothetical protein